MAPPATGSCQTIVMYGVARLTVPAAHGAEPAICSGLIAGAVVELQIMVR